MMTMMMMQRTPNNNNKICVSAQSNRIEINKILAMKWVHDQEPPPKKKRIRSAALKGTTNIAQPAGDKRIRMIVDTTHPITTS